MIYEIKDNTKILSQIKMSAQRITEAASIFAVIPLDHIIALVSKALYYTRIIMIARREAARYDYKII